MYLMSNSDLIPHLKMRNRVTPNLRDVWQKLMNFYKVFTIELRGKKKF